MLKSFIIWVIIVATAIGGLYGFERLRVPCQQALLYTVGSFDARFGITEDEFRQTISQAEKPWEEALGYDIFRYDLNATFPINLIFDERQARTIESQALGAEWTAAQSQQSTIQGQYESLSSELTKARRAYDASVADFDERLARYNSRVAHWNSGPRIDQAELNQIQREEKRLRQDQARLEGDRNRVNALIAEANRYVRAGEQIAEAYNERLETFTKTYGTGGLFDQGVYEGTGIDIFQFDDRDHLRMVLVHELGHALGVEHVAGPTSIMYPTLGAQDVKHIALSAEDRAALTQVCSVTAWDLLLRDTFQAWSLLTT